MTQSKHTPGPWGFFKRENPSAYDICQLCPKDEGGPDGADIATVYGDNDKDRINARLIAAAPELLEATQGLLLWLADETIKRRLEGLDDCQPVKHALKAIAKARGENL